MSSTVQPEPPSGGSGPPSTPTITDRVRAQLPIIAPANAEEIAGALDIKASTASKILTNLYRAGEVEPMPKKRKADPARWRPVPPDRQADVAGIAQNQYRRNLFATIKNLPIPLQGTVVDQVLAASIGTEQAEKRGLCDEMKGGFVELYKAFGVLLDDRGDWLDGTALDEFGYEEGVETRGALGAGVGVDDGDIWDADVVVEVVEADDDADADDNGDGRRRRSTGAP